MRKVHIEDEGTLSLLHTIASCSSDLDSTFRRCERRKLKFRQHTQRIRRPRMFALHADKESKSSGLIDDMLPYKDTDDVFKTEAEVRQESLNTVMPSLGHRSSVAGGAMSAISSQRQAQEKAKERAKAKAEVHRQLVSKIGLDRSSQYYPPLLQAVYSTPNDVLPLPRLDGLSPHLLEEVSRHESVEIPNFHQQRRSRRSTLHRHLEAAQDRRSTLAGLFSEAKRPVSPLHVPDDDGGSSYDGYASFSQLEVDPQSFLQELNEGLPQKPKILRWWSRQKEM